jgi:tetratricopeptide (TPR) repeat protein
MARPNCLIVLAGASSWTKGYRHVFSALRLTQAAFSPICSIIPAGGSEMFDLWRKTWRDATSRARILLDESPIDLAKEHANASDLQKESRFAEAERLYRVILREFPEDVSALDNLADLRLKQDDALAAMDLLRWRLRIAPQSSTVYARLAARVVRRDKTGVEL